MSHRLGCCQRLIEQGHAAIADRMAQRCAAIEGMAGAATGPYGTGYLAELRSDWDEA